MMMSLDPARGESAMRADAAAMIKASSADPALLPAAEEIMEAIIAGLCVSPAAQEAALERAKYELQVFHAKLFFEHALRAPYDPAPFDYDASAAAAMDRVRHFVDLAVNGWRAP